eukprot:Amastigsp_a325_18.p2 type:complete len:425 gc:universal Amastigsp_a325_18:1299-25(-)
MDFRRRELEQNQLARMKRVQERKRRCSRKRAHKPAPHHFGGKVIRELLQNKNDAADRCAERHAHAGARNRSNHPASLRRDLLVLGEEVAHDVPHTRCKMNERPFLAEIKSRRDGERERQGLDPQSPLAELLPDDEPGEDHFDVRNARARRVRRVRRGQKRRKHRKANRDPDVEDVVHKVSACAKATVARPEELGPRDPARAALKGLAEKTARALGRPERVGAVALAEVCEEPSRHRHKRREQPTQNAAEDGAHPALHVVGKQFEPWNLGGMKRACAEARDQLLDGSVVFRDALRHASKLCTLTRIVSEPVDRLEGLVRLVLVRKVYARNPHAAHLALQVVAELVEPQVHHLFPRRTDRLADRVRARGQSLELVAKDRDLGVCKRGRTKRRTAGADAGSAEHGRRRGDGKRVHKRIDGHDRPSAN